MTNVFRLLVLSSPYWEPSSSKLRKSLVSQNAVSLARTSRNFYNCLSALRNVLQSWVAKRRNSGPKTAIIPSPLPFRRELWTIFFDQRVVSVCECLTFQASNWKRNAYPNRRTLSRKRHSVSQKISHSWESRDLSCSGRRLDKHHSDHNVYCSCLALLYNIMYVWNCDKPAHR